MGSVVRLVTSVDVDDDFSSDRQISLSARHEAELEDGRRVLLLDDRGWSESGPPDAWAMSVEHVVFTTRMVVGPDEPFAGRTHADMAADHWAALAGTLQQRGVSVDAAELERSPHDVVLSERLRQRLDQARR
jgi:hypothetical protein